MKFLAAKTFTKNDLEDGMVVEYADGRRRLVAGELLLGNDGFGKLKDYSNTLEYIGYFYFDPSENLQIDKVYVANTIMLPKYFNDENLNLIWKREEPKIITIADIEKAIGYNLEIINE